MNYDNINRDDILDSEIRSGVEFLSILEKIDVFFSNVAPQITAFFLGTSDNLVALQFKELFSLKKEVEDKLTEIRNSKENFNLYFDWVLLEFMQDSLSRLQTLENFSSWARSNRDINIYAGNIEVDFIQEQEQTLEQISDEAGIESWYQIAVRNQLREEDYSAEGGKRMKVIINNAPTVFLQSVIDRLDNGLKTYGLDIADILEFNNDDLVVLNNEDTLMQSSKILLNLRKGDNPALPNLGIDQVSLLGSNRGSFLFPVIIRQLIEIFSTDDSFGVVSVGKIKFDQDALFMEVEINSRFKKTIEGLITL